MAQREITGRHVLIGFVAAFGIIIGVNVVLAVAAIRTFPGLEVANGYVASQTFDKRRRAQEALGWRVTAHHAGELRLAITDGAGEPVRVASLDVTVGRPTYAADDVHPRFRFDGSAYVAPVDLAGGNWTIWIKATAENGTPFEQRIAMIKD